MIQKKWRYLITFHKRGWKWVSPNSTIVFTHYQEDTDSFCLSSPPPQLTGLWSLCFSVHWSKVAAVAPRQASQGKKQWVWPPSEPSTHGAKSLQKLSNQYLSMLHQSEPGHSPMSKSIHIHRKWDHCAWFRLFTAAGVGGTLSFCTRHWTYKVKIL